MYTCLVEHYESKSNLMVISQKCHSRIQSLKLTRQFRGGAQAFVTQLQNAFLDLEYCTEVETTDLHKKTTLLLAIEDSNYFALRDTLAMDQSKDYLASMAAIDQHATMFMPDPNKRTLRRMNNTMKTSDDEAKPQSESKPAKKVNKKKKRSKQKNTQARDSDYISSVDQSVWSQLPTSVQKLIADARRKQRQRQDNGNGQNSNNGGNGGNQARRNNNIRAAEESNNVQGDSDEDSGEPNEQQEEVPSLRSVMRSNQSRRRSKQTTTITVHKKQRARENPSRDQNYEESESEDEIEVQEEVLIDSGADTSCLGPAFRVIATTDRVVDIVGYDDSKAAVDLPVGDGITLATNAEGEKVLLRVNEAIINANCKSILSVDQMRHYDIDVNEKPRRYGGQQNLVTLEEQVIPLQYRESLVWLRIERPTKEDMALYPIIQLTSDQPWDPGNQGDGKRAANPTRIRPKPPEVERI